jgi:chromosome partitioning protein
MITAVLNQKGGVGKTTLATHVAGERSKGGKSVVVIDADPQGSALDWAHKRNQSRLPRRFGVDGPPRVTALARSAILAADLVPVSVQPSPHDIWASSEIVALINETRIFKPWLKAAFVVNRRSVRMLIGRELRAGLEEVVAQPMPTLVATVSQRVVFAKAAAAGRLVGEIDDDTLAAREIACYADEVREWLR